ncbi:hypothetical protein ACAF76_011770 [Brevibacillus sp. TJ4]|uniref:hypothetical protein n=1 Tax=Brevibacillus sp. TJ4 TaxID=3234853 RepID=UPI0037D2702C
MQLKKINVVFSLLATLALLFGGWFLYQKIQIEEPIRAQIGQLESATLNGLKMESENIHIDLTVTNPEKFPNEYKQLLEKTTKLAGDKKVVITVANSSEEIRSIWHQGQFVFTEAIDLHQYSRIPELMEEWKASNGLDEAFALMDETHIYVYMKKGTEDFYTIVSRSMENEVNANA